MLKLNDPTTVPPGGFKYFQRETQTWLTAPSREELFSKVRSHRNANHLPIPSEWQSEVEEQLCSYMPPGTCRHVGGGSGPIGPGRQLTLAEVESGTLALGEWLVTGMERVPQEEADRRSHICSACPFNQNHANCTTCATGHVTNLVAKVVGNKRTIAHDRLHMCWTCGCALKALVWFPLNLIRKHKNAEQLGRLPDYCWQNV